MGNRNTVFMHPGILLSLKEGNPAPCDLRGINHAQKDSVFIPFMCGTEKNKEARNRMVNARGWGKRMGHMSTKTSAGQYE